MPDEEFVDAFLEESRENLEQLERDMVALESDPADADRLARVFRAMHTIKGTCGFLGFSRLEALSHAGEDLLSALRSGSIVLSADVTTTILQLADDISGTLRAIEATGTEGDDTYEQTVAAVRRHLSPSPVVEKPVLRAPSGHADRTPGESTVRVDVHVLDELMDLVGELVQARNEIAEVASQDEEGPLARPYRQLRVAMGDLQEGVMRARLQPIGVVTSRFPRVVRDLAVELGKQIELHIDGEDVGVDRALNEALAEPLVHLLRNAVDHGIETPDERLAAGKPPTGTISIRAFHEGGRVQIDVSDDGRGIDADRLVAKAVAEGMIPAEDAPALSRREVLDLIFRPGLSTKGEITNTSGRGVGMDAVRANLERVGGSIEVSTEASVGSFFRISVPLTLAVMPSVLMWCGGQRYAVPQVEVEEVVHLEGHDLAGAIDEIDTARMYRRRGRLVPLVDLAAQLGVPSAKAGNPTAHGNSIAAGDRTADGDGTADRNGDGTAAGNVTADEGEDGLTIVVIATGDKRFGLLVDAVADMTDIVVKPLTEATRGIDAFAGVTILADGCPALILDCAGLATRAGLASGTGVIDGASAQGSADTSTPAAGASDLLIVGTGGGHRLAVPLAVVRRLEQFSPESIEYAGDVGMVQYGETLLPLVRLSDALGGDGPPSADAVVLHTVICRTSGGDVGIVVDRIEDIVSEESPVSHPTRRRGVDSTLVVDDRVTELLDVETFAPRMTPA